MNVFLRAFRACRLSTQIGFRGSLTFVFVNSLTIVSIGQPTILGYAHFVDRFAVHSLPLLPVGDKVQLGAFLSSADPIASPTISVQFNQGVESIPLDPIEQGHPLYEGQHLFYKFINYNPSLLASWTIAAADSLGTASSLTTNSIAAPALLPFAENIVVQPTAVNSVLSWSYPSLSGLDVEFISVRLIEAATGYHVWQSELLTLNTTSFSLPAGVAQPSVEYVFWVNLIDAEGNYIENSSKAFSPPFRLSVPEPAAATLLLLGAAAICCQPRLRCHQMRRS